MTDILNLAFVGCGAIARFHLDGVRDCGGKIKVTAAVDPDRARAEDVARQTGAEVFTSLEEAIAKGEFDAVDILVPHDLHEALSRQAFQAGKHVLLEKPMAPTPEACERVLADARSAGTVFMVAENAQYWPEVVKAKELIDGGVIGEIITARANFAVEFDGYWFSDRKPWRYERGRTGGGIVIDGGSHWIRPLRMWMGEIEEAIGVVDHPLRRMEGESLARALFRLRSGKVATFDAMMVETVLGPDASWRVVGTKGEIVIDWGVKLFDAEHRDGRPMSEPQGYAKSFAPELDDFAEAVLHGRPLAAGPEHAVGELRTALAIYRSVESKRWEKVWD